MNKGQDDLLYPCCDGKSCIEGDSVIEVRRKEIP